MQVSDAEALVEDGGSPQPAVSPGVDAQAAAAMTEAAAARAKPKESLLNAAARARRGQVEETEHERIIREEEEILRNITAKTALQAVGERAKVSAPAYCPFAEVAAGAVGAVPPYGSCGALLPTAPACNDRVWRACLPASSARRGLTN